jgi:uncharacterized protein with beta-barrel porin domain
LHALLIAAFAGTKNRDRNVRAACRDCRRSRCRHVSGAGAIADADTHPDPYAFTDAQSDADGDQFDGVVGCGGDQSRQQFPGTTGQPVEQRLNRLQRTNPGGGGASESAEAPRYRTWFEGYGISATNGPLVDFVGDKRKTLGGVAGIGARVAPGINIGFSVDQSRSDIDIPLALQSATIDLTQLGFTASVDSGPWTWASAAVHGFGNINSRRDTGFGLAIAGYNARLDGVLSEISYYWSKDQGRLVPKAAFEYVRARTGALQEIGGLDPVMATSATVQRARLLIGAEVGRYWIFDQKILDLSAYGKFVDNVVQNFSDITVSLGSQSVTLQGIGESRYGADVGASASLSLTNTARLYVNYDAKYRAAMQSHQGTLGVELKW